MCRCISSEAVTLPARFRGNGNFPPRSRRRLCNAKCPNSSLHIARETSTRLSVSSRQRQWWRKPTSPVTTSSSLQTSSDDSIWLQRKHVNTAVAWLKDLKPAVVTRPVESHSGARKTIIAGFYHNLIPYAPRSRRRRRRGGGHVGGVSPYHATTDVGGAF